MTEKAEVSGSQSEKPKEEKETKHTQSYPIDVEVVTVDGPEIHSKLAEIFDDRYTYGNLIEFLTEDQYDEFMDGFRKFDEKFGMNAKTSEYHDRVIKYIWKYYPGKNKSAMLRYLKEWLGYTEIPVSVGNTLGTKVKIKDDLSGVVHTDYCVGNFKKPGFVIDTEKDKVIKKVKQPGLIISDGNYIHRLLGGFETSEE